MLFNGGTIPWYMTMRSYHLTDNVWGLVLSGGLPVFNVIMAMNFFRNLPSELEEVAYVDGADPWTSFIKINIPLAKPMIATITLLTIVGHWNDFFQGLVLSTKQSNYPLQTYIQQMVVTQNYSTMTVEQIKEMVQLNNQSLDAAKIFIAMVPILMIYPFLQKYFVKGITLGSVKG
jgi:ABC-type glycerol-3-phosphate transport system permease component